MDLRAWRLLLPLLLLTLLAPAPSRADDDAVVLRDERQIREFSASLTSFVDLVPADRRYGTVILLQSIAYDCGRFESTRTENRSHHVFTATSAPVPVAIALGRDDVRTLDLWVLRADGGFQRWGRGAFTITRDAAGTRSARLELPPMDAGDRWGWTSSTRRPHGLAFRREPLALDHDLVRGRLRVRGEAMLTHRVVARNVPPDTVTMEVTDRRRGFPTELRVDYGDLPARTDPPFTLPPLRRLPYLEIVRQGRFYQELDLWTLSNDWDLWVALELGQPQSWIERDGLVNETAWRVVDVEPTDRGRADALYRFVRDEIRTIDPGVSERLFGDTGSAHNLDLVALRRELDEEQDSPLSQRLRDAQQLPPVRSEFAQPEVLGPGRSPHEVLRTREGTRLEKTVLLASLFEAVYLPSRFGFARDREFGPIDHESAGSWQFTDAFVVLLTPDLRPDLWYCVTRDHLPPGVLPVGLQRRPMLNVHDDFELQLAALWTQAGREVGPHVQQRMPKWVQLVRSAGWARWVETPGSPGDLCARIEERVRWSEDAGTVDVEVVGRGEVAIDAAEHLRARFGEAEILEGPTVADRDPLDVARQELHATLAAPALPAPADGAWALPGPTLFGPSAFAGWDRNQPDFHVERTTERVWTVELPLPRAWSRLEPVPEFVQQHTRAQYGCEVTARDGRLVVERRLRLVAGTSPNRELAELVGNVLAFEAGWLTVRESRPRE